MKCPDCNHEVIDIKYIHSGSQHWNKNGRRWDDCLYSREYLCGYCNYCFTDEEIGKFGFYIDALKAHSMQALKDGKIEECVRLYNKAYELERKQS